MIYQWYHWQQKNVQGFLVTIGKNCTNSTIGRFTDFTIGRTSNVAIDSNRLQTEVRVNEDETTLYTEDQHCHFHVLLGLNSIVRLD